MVKLDTVAFRIKAVAEINAEMNTIEEQDSAGAAEDYENNNASHKLEETVASSTSENAAEYSAPPTPDLIFPNEEDDSNEACSSTNNVNMRTNKRKADENQDATDDNAGNDSPKKTRLEDSANAVPTNEAVVAENVTLDQSKSSINDAVSSDDVASCSNGISLAVAPVKQEPNVEQEPVNPIRHLKPVAKVEPIKAEASSSTMRQSCKFGIRCYRRNPMHRVEEAHPGDSDYRRPSYPEPPAGTPPCPYGKLCYRRNPIHYQQFSHPPEN